MNNCDVAIELDELLEKKLISEELHKTIWNNSVCETCSDKGFCDVGIENIQRRVWLKSLSCGDVVYQIRHADERSADKVEKCFVKNIINGCIHLNNGKVYPMTDGKISLDYEYYEIAFEADLYKLVNWKDESIKDFVETAKYLITNKIKKGKKK